MSNEGQELIDAVLDFDEDDVIEQVKKMRDSGKMPLEIMEVAKTAMDEVGRKFQEKEFFLTELIMSGELLNTIMLELGLTGESSQTGESKGKIVLGTVKDDIHDIGKNILKSLLISNGFEVIDIGVDVPINKFIDEVRKYDPQVVAMSGLLTIAYNSMKTTIEGFQKAGIRDKFKIIIGGGSIDQQVADYTGADDFGASAIDGVDKIKNWF